LGTLAARNDHGWVRWFWEDGLELLFWRRSDATTVVGVQTERAALKARMASATLDAPGLVRLRDSRAQIVAQWGDAKGLPLISATLASPLEDWRLELVPIAAERNAFISSGSRLWALAAIMLALIVAAVVVTREQRRALRDAETRVSFVTQVSHELKTPLTNIRLYAEMLSERIDAEDETGVRYAKVITQEAQRLGRLIDNVLGFSRAPELHPRPIVLDALIHEIVEEFRPSFRDRGIEASVLLGNVGEIISDPDAIAQIVANLLSNVEKYAAAGKRCEVETVRDAADIRIIVRDFGPGIAVSDQSRIFDAYVRLQDRMNEGVTGTGLGLAIARDLARALGGNLQCVPTDGGAQFVLSIRSTA